MFKIHSDYKPKGDQPKAIEYLSNGIKTRQEIPDVTGSYRLAEKLLQWRI